MPFIENEQIDQMEESKSLKKNEENGIKMIRRDSKKCINILIYCNYFIIIF